ILLETCAGGCPARVPGSLARWARLTVAAQHRILTGFPWPDVGLTRPSLPAPPTQAPRRRCHTTAPAAARTSSSAVPTASAAALVPSHAVPAVSTGSAAP